MGAALNLAAASGAYVLSDRATWIHFNNKVDLQIVVQGDQRQPIVRTTVLGTPATQAISVDR